jgi:pimeloyl-ACP methyl ester carboxylesterase
LARDADVVLFDYPGYGESTGAPTPALILETALAVYDYAAGLEAPARQKRVLYGFSLGGLVASQVAGVRPVDGLVLEATAQNADSWARSQIPWYLKPVVRPRIESDLASVDAVSALQHFSGRVLLLGGRADRKAPAALSVRLQQQLLQAGVHARSVLFDDAGHGDIPHAPKFEPVLRDFVDQLSGPAGASLRISE